jgi:hypothetical protein
MPLLIILICAVIYMAWDGDQRNRKSSKRNRDFVKSHNELYKDMPDMQIK